MSEDKNLIRLNPSDLGEYTGLYLKEVSTINDGDTLVITDSEGTNYEMGDLIPRPARNVVSVNVNEDGNLLFVMDEEGIVYDAGKIAIQAQYEENFPAGFGALTQEGSLKTLVSNGRVKVVEDSEKFTLSLEPLENISDSNVINTENPAKHQSFTLSKEVTLDEYVFNGEIKVTGQNFPIAENVTLYKGLNTLVLISDTYNTNNVDVVLKLAGTDTTYKHVNFIVSSLSRSREPLIREIETNEDVLVDISIRLDNTDSIALYVKHDTAKIDKKIEMFNLAIRNKVVDTTSLVQYVPPEGTNDYSNAKVISDFLKRQPTDYQREYLFSERVYGGYGDIFHYGDEIFFLPRQSLIMLIKNIVTNELTKLNTPFENMSIYSTLQRGDIVYISVNGERYIKKFDLTTKEFGDTDVIRYGSSLVLYWNHEMDRLVQVSSNGSYFWRDDEDSTQSSYFLDNEGNRVTVRPESVSSMFHNSKYMFPIDEEIPSGDHSFYGPEGPLNIPFTAAVVYESLTEIGVLLFDQAIPSSEYVYASWQTAASTNIRYETLADTSYSSYLFTKTGSAHWSPNTIKVKKPRFSKPVGRDFEITGFDIGFSLYLQAPTSRNYPKVLAIKGSKQAELPTHNFKVYEGERLDKPFTDGNPQNVWFEEEHARNHYKRLWYSSAFGSFKTDMREVQTIESLSIMSSTVNDLRYYDLPTHLTVETSLDGETWEKQKIGEAKSFESLEESSIYALPALEGKKIKGIRFETMAGTTSSQIYSFMPATTENGELKDYPFGKPILEEGITHSNSFYTEDGSKWDATPSVNTHITLSLSNLLNPVSMANYFYFENDYDAIRHVQVIFPEPVEISHLAHDINANGQGVGRFLYTLDGETWIEFAKLKDFTKGARINHNALGIDFAAREHFPITDGQWKVTKLANPVSARYLKITGWNSLRGQFYIGRIKVNRVISDEMETIATLNFDDDNLPEELESVTLDTPYIGRTILVEVIEEGSNTTRAIYIDHVNFKTNLKDKLSGELFSLTDSSKRQLEMELEYEDGQAEKDFLIQMYVSRRNNTINCLFDENDNMVGFYRSRSNVQLFNDGKITTIVNTPNFHGYNGDMKYIDRTIYLVSANTDYGIFATSSLDFTTNEFEFSYPDINLENIDSGAYVRGYLRDPKDPYSFYLSTVGDTGIPVINTKDGTMKEFNRPFGVSNTNFSSAILSYAPFYNELLDLVIFPPMNYNDMYVIHPVGSEVARRETHLSTDEKKYYLSLPDSYTLSRDFCKYRVEGGSALVSGASNIEYRGTDSHPHSSTWTRGTTDVFRLTYEFQEAITFDSFNFNPGGYPNVNQQFPADLRFYISDDGETWEEIFNETASSVGFRNTSYWNSIDLDAEHTTRFLRFETDVADDKYGCFMGTIVPTSRTNSTYITTEYNRVEVIGNVTDAVEYGYTYMTRGKFYVAIDLGNGKVLCPAVQANEGSLLYDKATHTWEPVYLKGENAGFYNYYKDYDGQLFLLNSTGDRFLLKEDFQVERVEGESVGLNGYRMAYSHEGSIISTSDYSNSFTYRNLINNLTASSSYGGLPISRSTFEDQIVAGDKLIVATLEGGENAVRTYPLQNLHHDGELLHNPYAASGASVIARLPNGSLFVAPRSRTSANKRDFFYLLVPESASGEDDPDFDKILELEG